ncbi:MAG: hypothetical protein NC131_21410 [Roseburia sp.]|nr:hypothetical protein [Corallococcus sp.]MCM1441743.1 hypothetical protein [Roseburia sp.]
MASIIIGILIIAGITVAVVLGKRVINKRNKRNKKNMVEDVDGFYDDATEE